MKRIAVIASMNEELAYLKSVLKIRKQDKVKTIGLLGEKEVILYRCGMGKVNGALATAKVIYEEKADAVLNIGTSGAIDEHIQPLDIVLSTEALYHDFDVSGFGFPKGRIPMMKTSLFLADKILLEKGRTAFSLLEKSGPLAISHLYTGRIATGDQFIASTEARKKVVEAVSPLCVDMEGAAVAHTCYLYNIPWLIIRCMSDKADNNGQPSSKEHLKDAAAISCMLTAKLIEGLR